MRSRTALGIAFESIVVSVAAAGALAVACGGSTSGATDGDGGTLIDGGDGGTTDGGFAYTGFTLVQPREACVSPPLLVAGIHPADPDSAIELREATVSDAFFADAGALDATGCPIGVVSNITLERYGTMCSHAKDAATCASKVACALPPGTGWLSYVCSGPCARTDHGKFYVQVSGDTLTFPTDLLAMLGTIDTPMEAVLVAQQLGYLTPTDCGAALPAAYRAAGGGYELLVLKSQDCGTGVTQVLLRINADGTSVVVDQREIVPPSTTACAAGRRPEGLALESAGGAALGMRAYLSELAELEAASIAEFATLRDELRAHGAPARLVREAERARRDEIMHARVTERLASAYGGGARRLTIARSAPRDLERLAVHNAVEGCVRETFGALLATWQARHAADAAVAEAFVTIAEDETRHASFSWQLASWLDTKLGVASRARVEAARDEAIAELRRQLRTAPHAEVAAGAGVPDVATAERLLEEMLASFGVALAA